MKQKTLVLLLLLSAAISACGQRGPLFMPQVTPETAQVVKDDSEPDSAGEKLKQDKKNKQSHSSIEEM